MAQALGNFMQNIPLISYTDKLSGRPGDTIEFKVSSASDKDYSAKLFRSISADPNPAGAGIVEEDASAYFPPTQFRSREQLFQAGSYAVSKSEISVKPTQYVIFSAFVFLTKTSEHKQTILCVDDADLHIDTSGALALSWENKTSTTNTTLQLRSWYKITAKLEANGEIQLSQTSMGNSFAQPHSSTISNLGLGPNITTITGRPSIAARLSGNAVSQYFNGKIEAPSIVVDDRIIAAWDFSQNISTTKVHADVGPNLELINYPARAITGSQWDGSEMNWRHKPEHYGAIHFHDDDIYDFNWDTDFAYTIPDDMPSGIYVMRFESDMGADAIPFFVCAPKGKPSAKLCVLVSTFTYTIYGNHARPDYQPEWQDRISEWEAYPNNPAEYPQYGLSTYNYHSDGSGICHASHRRPLLNLRPGFLTFGTTPCSGLRHFQADSHLISWLHAMDIEYDIVTDMELHRDGISSIEGYAAVTTATHPEYHTEETLNALRDYRNKGGALNYLGGNGFYWRIAAHEENDSMLEIRRAEDGIRAWAAEPGEYYNAFDGSYGGLWRRNARAPQELVGIGFAAQGEFQGSPYQRVNKDPEMDWVFDGVTDDVIGDFGFSGQGAAGFELDRCDARLGTPENVKILARSITRDGSFMLVPEEQLTHLTNLSGGPEEDVLHADMIYFDVPGGGSVFATGSITFCGSLPWNNFNNNISRILSNVFNKSLNAGN